MKQIALVGNPNTGKTTLFNVLTGSRQRVGNWSGVTVERKSGILKYQKQNVEVVDLPGIYSLNVSSANTSVDEKIACDYILSDAPALIVNIVDASHLERSLYLTVQLQEMGVPLLLVVTMLDIARLRKKHIDLEKLGQQFGCRVVGVVANRKKGIEQLQKAILESLSDPLPAVTPVYAKPLEKAIHYLATHLFENKRWAAIRCLERDGLCDLDISLLEQHHEHCREILGIDSLEDADIALADARYSLIATRLKECVSTYAAAKPLTTVIDKLVLNRYLGIPIFLMVMYAMFIIAINLGGVFQDFFEITSDTLFVGGMEHLLTWLGFNPWLTALFSSGIGSGITTTAGFIPVIGGLFLCLSFLESSGYMARAAFVMDRVMRALGLPGKAFVPMIIGFGCNVPAVMATRTLDNRRDRILAIMMSPFMSCGARLAIYSVFVSAFFPTGGQNIVFILYVVGIVMAVLTGFLLRTTLLEGTDSTLVMELPPYHIPSLRNLFLNTWHRLKNFITKAGKVILPLCLVISFLNAITPQGELTSTSNIQEQNSVLSAIGKTVTPLFSPMGITQENWPATVGLVTGMLAKEVVVATLNTLYTQAGNLAVEEEQAWSLTSGLKAAVYSIPDNFKKLGQSFRNPIAGSMPDEEMEQMVYGQMINRFGGTASAFAYLLFLLLYFPCVSTTAVMVRELNRQWAFLSVAWTTGLAYISGVVFFQIATFTLHPWSSLSWIGGFMVMIGSCIFYLRQCALDPMLKHSVLRKIASTDLCGSQCKQCFAKQ